MEGSVPNISFYFREAGLKAPLCLRLYDVLHGCVILYTHRPRMTVLNLHISTCSCYRSVRILNRNRDTESETVRFSFVCFRFLSLLFWFGVMFYFFACFVGFLICFWDRISYSPHQSWTHFIVKNDLEFLLSAFTTQMLGLGCLFHHAPQCPVSAGCSANWATPPVTTAVLYLQFSD